MGAIFFVSVQWLLYHKTNGFSALDFKIVKTRGLIEIYGRKISKPLVLEVSINVLISILHSECAHAHWAALLAGYRKDRLDTLALASAVRWTAKIRANCHVDSIISRGR